MPPTTRSMAKTNSTGANTDVFRSFNFSIPLFSGESDKVKWFINQVKDLRKINGWPDEVALMFLKSRLAGSAQEWFSTSPSCHNADFEKACTYLDNFFSESSAPAANVLAFQQIQLIPGETIKNLAHRVEKLAVKTYDTITDSKAMNQVKSLQFLNALPIDIREKLMLQEESDFGKLVEIAHKISVAHQGLGTLCTNFAAITQSQCSGGVSSVNVETYKRHVDEYAQQTPLICPYCGSGHLMKDCVEFRSVVRPQGENQYLNRLNVQNDFTAEAFATRGAEFGKGPPFCMFCQKRGHSMANCWEYQASLRCTHSSEQVGGEIPFRNTFNSPRNSGVGFRSRGTARGAAYRGVRQQWGSDRNGRGTSFSDSDRHEPLNFQRDR